MGYNNDPDDFDAHEQLAVLDLIIERSPRSAADALRAKLVPHPAARQLRLDRIILQALADPDCEWNREERVRLRDAVPVHLQVQ